MALSIKDIAAASFPAIINEKNKAANQWAESAALRYMQKMGFIKRKPLGVTIDCTLDYTINAGAGFLATDITSTSLSKTSVVGAASFAVAEVSVPIVWTKRDEATNPSENQKVAYVKQLIENGLNSHDKVVEDALFAASATQGFLSIPLLATEDGTGTVGGIVAGTDTMWKNQFDDYTTGGALLLPSMTTVYNACSKGSGSTGQPTLIITSAAQHGQFEAQFTGLRTYTDSDEAVGGYKALSFKNAKVIFTPSYTSDSYFFVNSNACQLVVSESHFRHQGETNEIDNANGYVTKLYSALQLVTNNRSRLGVSFT